MSVPAAARERLVTWQDPMIIASRARDMAGIAVLNAVLDSRLPAPPIARLLGFDLVEAQHGRVLFRAEPAEHNYKPIGLMHGGLVATVLDSALGCAVHARLPAGAGYTTVDLTVTFVRPVTGQTGPILCEAEALHVGRKLASARGTVRRAADDALLAHGQAAIMVLGQGGGPS